VLQVDHQALLAAEDGRWRIHAQVQQSQVARIHAGAPDDVVLGRLCGSTAIIAPTHALRAPRRRTEEGRHAAYENSPESRTRICQVGEHGLALYGDLLHCSGIVSIYTTPHTHRSRTQNPAKGGFVWSEPRVRCMGRHFT
jgi:hypothetical protein